MAKAFSKMMSASEGRYLTAIESEHSLRASLELPHRMLVSQLIQHSEFEIVDFATHAFCDMAPGFEAPNGSLRRKKGHQDGRIILRYAAQAIREGSTEIVFEKVLSWLVGHLDGGNVTGEHMEVFFHFIQQGARRELPAHAHPFIDNVFEEIIGCVRRASYSATILKAHRRIAEFAVDRVMSILPDVKAKYGASSVPKCKRDVELLVKEVARLMKSESPHAMKKQFSSWLIDQLMNQVEYSSDVWYWMFLAIREGVVECCSPEASLAVNELFETMADQVDAIKASIQLTSMSGEISDIVAERLIQRGESLGLLRVDEFQTNVSMVNRQLISEIAILHACGSPDSQVSEVAAIWEQTVLAQMPSNNTSLLASNLKLLLEVVNEKAGEHLGKAFRVWVQQFVEVARRTESVSRLTEVIDRAAVESANWAIDNLSPFTADRRAAYRDIRLVLAKILTLIPSGPAGVNGVEFRQYITRYLLPNLPFNASVLQQVYERVVRVIESHAQPEDAKLVVGYLNDAMGCLDRHPRLHRIGTGGDRMLNSAVERGYIAAPRHESLQRNGIAAGRRDGKFLLEKVIEAATVGGPIAEAQLHSYFFEEQVRLSRLPGRVVVEFLRGMLEHLREFPEVAELIFGLTQAAPAYTAAIKINKHSKAWADTISQNAVDKAPAYREQLGASGLEACARDNAVMLRGLSNFLVHSPGDVSDFKQWWRKRIGKNIRLKPESFESSGPCAKTNFNEVIAVFRENLDEDEANAVSNYMNQIFEGRTNAAPASAATSKRPFMGIPISTLPPVTTFSDVGL